MLLKKFYNEKDKEAKGVDSLEQISPIKEKFRNKILQSTL